MSIILKKGVKSEQVETWQEFLSAQGFYKHKIDGDFGNFTHDATVSFQKKNKLLDDGIVGAKTFKVAFSLGYGTTDCVEQVIYNTTDSLKINQHFLSPKEFLKSSDKKEWLYWHHTAGWEDPYRQVDIWENDNRGAVATEFLIGGQRITNDVVGANHTHDGVVVQAFPQSGYGWHLGVGNTAMHRNSVGIELNNFGYLTKGGYVTRVNGERKFVAKNKDKFYTYVGTMAHESQIVDLGYEFRGYRYWHRYSDAQVESLRLLSLHIANRDNIDIRKGLPDLIRKEGVKAFDKIDRKMCENTKGLWLHTNLQKSKYDLFPQEEIVEMILSF